MRLRDAVSKINARGILLVFPLQNRPEPASLWSEFFPRRSMRWEWDDGGDTRVPQLWHLREELSRSKKVVYAKWFRGRATMFSRAVFVDCFRALNAGAAAGLSREARALFERLREESPLSTKELRRRSRLQGKPLEGTYTRALAELWQRLWIVGFGEVDDGAFPSLAIGATEHLFEDLVAQAETRSPAEAERALGEQLGEDSLFFKEFRKIQAKVSRPATRAMPKVLYGET